MSENELKDQIEKISQLSDEEFAAEANKVAVEANAVIERTIDEAVDEMPIVMKDYWIRVLFSLNQYPRFAQFVADNYLIQQGVDDETKQVHLRIIEKPPTESFELTLQQSLKLQLLLKAAGVKDTANVTENVIKILGGGEAEGTVVGASEADLKRELAKK